MFRGERLEFLDESREEYSTVRRERKKDRPLILRTEGEELNLRYDLRMEYYLTPKLKYAPRIPIKLGKRKMK